MVTLYGLHACRAALLNPRRIITRVWCTAAVERDLLSDPLISKARCLAKRRPSVVDRKQLESLVPGGSVHQGLVLQVEPLETVPLETLGGGPANQRIVVLDQVTDPQNVGSILRLCRVFGARALVMTKRHAPPESGALAKVASGALEVVPRCLVTNLADALRSLKDVGFWTVGLAEGCPSTLRSLDLKGKMALLMGAEGKGLRRQTRELCDFQAVIPTSPQFSTLNVTTATAIALYETWLAQSESCQTAKS